MSTERFGRMLEEARELNVTAPWQESQALLEALEPFLARATREQRVDYRLLTARNQALSGDFEAGLATLRALLPEPMETKQRVRAYALAANLATLARSWEETFEYLIRALELEDRLQPADRVGLPFSLAAYLYAKVGEMDAAIEHGHTAVAVARADGSRRDLCVNQGRLAYVYKMAEQRDLALRHYRQALEACADSGDELLAGTVESGMADLLRAAGRHEAAEKAFDAARDKLSRTGYKPGLAEARLYTARLYHDLGQHQRVRALIDQALPELEEQQAWDYVADAYEMIASEAASKGEFEQAHAHMKQSLEARRRYLDRDRVRQLAHLQVAFDTRSQQQEIALLREQGRAARLESRSRKSDQRLRWLVSGIVLMLLLGLFLGLAHVLRGRYHFRRLSQLDGLTGLSNHTRFFKVARQLAGEAARYGRPLILVLGDVDHFKRVNDEHGHIAGDRALKALARVLRLRAPEFARIGRIGGEEFAVCLPDTTLDSATAYLDRVRDDIAGINYAGDGPPLTMSFGLAVAADGESLDSLRRRADEALYRAKNFGRNRTVVAD